MRKVYLALGGNLGNVEATFERAVMLLGTHVGEVQARSRIYTTRALLDPNNLATPQPDYRNMALACSTVCEPIEILQRCLEIETLLGRVRDSSQRWRARTIDIDLLLIDDLIVSSTSLTLPHPEMIRRDFVLMPLCDIAPQTIHPVVKKNIAQLLQELIESKTERFVM